MNPTIMIVISTSIVLIFAGMFSVYMGRRSKTGEDWAVGGRSLPTYVIVGTLYATAMGGGMLVAHVGIGYKSGWSVLSYGLCITGGLLILTFIAEYWIYGIIVYVAWLVVLEKALDDGRPQ